MGRGPLHLVVLARVAREASQNSTVFGAARKYRLPLILPSESPTGFGKATPAWNRPAWTPSGNPTHRSVAVLAKGGGVVPEIAGDGN